MNRWKVIGGFGALAIVTLSVAAYWGAGAPALGERPDAAAEGALADAISTSPGPRQWYRIKQDLSGCMESPSPATWIEDEHANGVTPDVHSASVQGVETDTVEVSSPTEDGASIVSQTFYASDGTCEQARERLTAVPDDFR